METNLVMTFKTKDNKIQHILETDEPSPRLFLSNERDTNVDYNYFKDVFNASDISKIINKINDKEEWFKRIKYVNPKYNQKVKLMAEKAERGWLIKINFDVFDTIEIAESKIYPLLYYFSTKSLADIVNNFGYDFRFHASEYNTAFSIIKSLTNDDSELLIEHFNMRHLQKLAGRLHISEKGNRKTLQQNLKNFIEEKKNKRKTDNSLYKNMSKQAYSDILSLIQRAVYSTKSKYMMDKLSLIYMDFYNIFKRNPIITVNLKFSQYIYNQNASYSLEIKPNSLAFFSNFGLNHFQEAVAGFGITKDKKNLDYYVDTKHKSSDSIMSGIFFDDVSTSRIDFSAEQFITEYH